MSRIREGLDEAGERWQMLHVLQKHYKEFVPFLVDCMSFLGFSTSEIQKDIGLYMQYGPMAIMVQAQRGQAKTTIAAIYCVWCLVHSPAHRILIFTAGEKLSKEISTLIILLIETMDILECLRPDKQAGDRTGVESYDIHHSLKGVDKSPSVNCMGIMANLQGSRADLLLADDIESGKNSRTAEQRAILAHITKDFTSICSRGRIIWLGTPQTQESIYNSLPARGVAVRVWPGRYPTKAQVDFYGEHLAPSIRKALELDPSLATGGGILGDQGKATDTVLLPEEELVRKELDQGEAYFQLQHMLNCSLADAQKYPLKPEKILVLRGAGEHYPSQVVRGMSQEDLRKFSHAGFAFSLTAPHSISQEVLPLGSKVMYIDPAAGGKNADETAYAIGGALNGNIFVLRIGGIPGGYTEDLLVRLAEIAAAAKVDQVIIEKNLGYGAFTVVFTPILRRKHPSCQILEDYVTVQKELRIIETLGPVMGRGSLVFTADAVQEDSDTLRQHPIQSQQTYGVFFQLAKISRVRGELAHDDRADALEGLVRHVQPAIAQDQEKQLQRQRQKAWEEATKDPLGHGRYISYGQMPKRKNILAARRASRGLR